MRSNWRHAAVLTFLATACLLGALSSEARAQAPLYSTQSVIVPGAPVATSQSYVVPTRRLFRSDRRYFTLRPNYGGRQPLSFAPFSDAQQSRFATAPSPTYYVVKPR